jgi:hypothetical protein
VPTRVGDFKLKTLEYLLARLNAMPLRAMSAAPARRFFMVLARLD